jgi:recombination protein RecA
MAKEKELKEKDMSSKDKAIEQAISAIEKQFGKGSIMRLGSTEQEPIQTIPSGSIALDIALGIGGLPRGRVIEVYGPEMSGKTTVALHAVAESQRSGGVVAFIDAEHALDIKYARRLGVDVNNLLICQPDFAEQALEIVDMLVRSNNVDLIVIDSVAALVPRAELDGDMGDAHVGLQARLMSQALRKLTASASKGKTALIFINQLRTKVGVMFGNPETTSGGNALKFYSSVRLDVRKVSQIKNSTDVVGQRTRIKVVKNKLAPPFREVEVDIIYGQGINRAGDVLDLGAALNIVDKSGAWYSYEGERLGNGREACKEFLMDNPDIMMSIENRIREAKDLPIIDQVLMGSPETDEDADSEA